MTNAQDPQTINQPDPVMYARLLANFDWSYEYSEDMRVYRKAEQMLVQLRQMQPKIDPTGEIWMRFKPKDCGPLPHVQTSEVGGNG